jgi:hypothetical protein
MASAARHPVTDVRDEDWELSTVYQVILEKGQARGEARGRVEEARTAVLRIGRSGLGAPSRAVRRALAGITDLHRLRRTVDQVLRVDSWKDLLEVS